MKIVQTNTTEIIGIIGVIVLLRSQLNTKISLSFKRDFENDHSKLRILVDSRLENQRIWRFVLTSTITIVTLVTIITAVTIAYCGVNMSKRDIESVSFARYEMNYETYSPLFKYFNIHK